MAQFIEFVRAIPESFWSVLGGGGIAAFVTWLTSRLAMKRQAEQFNHERATQEDERLFSLKREIYLNIIQVLPEHQTFLGQLAMIGTLGDAEPRQPLHLDIFAKAELVADEELLSELYAFVSTRANFVTELFKDRRVLREAKSKLEKEGAAVLERHATQLLTAAEISTYDEHHAAFMADYKRHMQRAVDIFIEFGKLQTRICACIRRELGLPTNEERLRELADVSASHLLGLAKNEIEAFSQDPLHYPSSPQGN